MFNKDIREWRHQTTDQKALVNYNTFFHPSHRKHRIAVTTAGKVGYNAMLHNIYGVPSPPPEDYHKAIDNLHTIFQRMQMQIYNLEGLAKSNSVLASYNSELMAQLEQMTETMKNMQAKLKTVASAPTNQTSSKRKYYCWGCGSNYTH